MSKFCLVCDEVVYPEYENIRNTLFAICPYCMKVWMDASAKLKEQGADVTGLGVAVYDDGRHSEAYMKKPVGLSQQIFVQQKVNET